MIGRFWKWVQARFRLDLDVVCEMSKGREVWNDLHDYPDTEEGIPVHFATLKCARCGKEFTI